MSLGLVGISSSIVSPKRTEHPNHWYTPTKNPNDVMKEQADKFIKRQEEKSLSKPAEERGVGDWLNVASSYVRKVADFAKGTVLY